MKSKRYDGTELRRVLAGMVTDRVVCARIASQWKDGGLFDSDWANLVGGWCVKHLLKYDQPPNGQLRSIFDQWSRRSEADEKTLVGIERFLGFVSSEWTSVDPPSSDYLLDLAKQYFNRVRAGQLIERATECIEENRPDEAIAVMNGANRVELGSGGLIKPAEEYDPWQQAFDPDRQRPLIEYPDGLGRFFGNVFGRDSLVAFMGPDKTGKSFWLLDVAFRAIRGRHRVAYFEVGDLLQDEALLRLGMRATRRPLEPGTYQFPMFISSKKNEEGKTVPVVECEERKFKVGLTSSEAYKAFRRICRGRDMLRLSCHANSTISVDGIQSIVQDWEREEWIPDVVVIDYADILAPPMGVRDVLDQTDETWKRLRRLSQEKHCLVVTASQSSALAYAGKDRTLSRKHFSGRKTKLAHVNAMIGINCTDEDKTLGIMRLNYVVRRNARFSESSVVTVAGCLGVASVAMKSLF